MAYAEFRQSYDKDAADSRIVFYGFRQIIEKYLHRPWTMEELQVTSQFLSTHNVGHSPFPFPAELFRKVVDEHDGWFPVKICALPEASVVYPHVPVYTISAEGEYSGLATFLETLLMLVWYPSTVATLSRRCRDMLAAAFDRSVDEEDAFLLESRLHDFGFRACATLEQAIIGGSAHLLSFGGTDTLPAAFHTQYNLNEGVPVASSVPASEHSVMLAYQRDSEAMRAIIERFGGGTYSIVMDTFDYLRALEEELPVVASEATAKGGFLVIRPDSGDPTEMTLAGLGALCRVFGARTNRKGFRVINGAGLIFGDGVDPGKMQQILEAVQAAGYSAQTVAFGMGSNLLHKVNRDTMSFATKMCYSRTLDGTDVDVAKLPKTDSSKFSLPGRFAVAMNGPHPVVHPLEMFPEDAEDGLETVYDCGPVNYTKRPFSELSRGLQAAWSAAPKQAAVLSPALRAKMAAYHAAKHC